MNLPRIIESLTKAFSICLFLWPAWSDYLGAQSRLESGPASAEVDSTRQKEPVSIPQPDSLMRRLERMITPGGEKISYSGERITFFPLRNVVLIQG
ncbi:MAG: hypothetical protein DRG82_17005, partial [Deltaproteobacteria bacterium]